MFMVSTRIFHSHVDFLLFRLRRGVEFGFFSFSVLTREFQRGEKHKKENTMQN